RRADVVDAERNQEPDKGRRLARLDPIEQVLRGLFGKALQGQQLRSRQVIEVGRVLDQLPIDQLLQGGIAKALDVEGGDEMAQVLEDLRRTGRIDAAGGRLARLADQIRAALRAFFRHVPGAARRRPLLGQHPDDFRNYVAGPLDDDVITGPHVLAGDLVFVVQRRAADRDATDLDRGEPGDG